MKKELIITVGGVANSGKSRITFLLKQFLREKGFEVELENSLDHPNEREFDIRMNKNLNNIIDFIKKRRKISLKQVQFNNENSKKDRYDSSIFTPPFRLGKKQRRAVLDANGLMVVLMEHKCETQAQMYVDYLNGL